MRTRKLCVVVVVFRRDERDLIDDAPPKMERSRSFFLEEKVRKSEPFTSVYLRIYVGLRTLFCEVDNNDDVY